MGFWETSRQAPYSARRVLFCLQGQPVNVKVEMRDMPSGMVFIHETNRRFGAWPLRYAVVEDILMITSALPSIHVRNTGNATAGPGGFANTGVAIGTTAIDPRTVAFRVPTLHGETWVQYIGHTREPKATITAYLAADGEHALI